MNNNSQLTINGVKVPLVFGMIAAEEFYRMQLSKGHTEESAANANQLLMICDAMYAGACNAAMLNRLPNPDYATFVDAVDDLYSNEDGAKELAAALEVWQESKFGKNVFSTNEAIKKKLDELQSQNNQTSTISENLPTGD